MINGINILAIETATSSCSVALNAGERIFKRSEVGNNIHSQCLLSMIEEVLAQAQVSVSDLSAVAVGQGPGSFTGLRIGIGVAQGIAYGIGCPMLGLSSLAALASMRQGDGYVITGIDARMNEIYWGVYKVSASNTQLIGDLTVSAPKDINLLSLNAQEGDIENDQILLAGNAWSEYEDELGQEFLRKYKPIEGSMYPTATALLGLAQGAYQREEFIAPIDFTPEYVRDKVAFKKST